MYAFQFLLLDLEVLKPLISLQLVICNLCQAYLLHFHHDTQLYRVPVRVHSEKYSLSIYFVLSAINVCIIKHDSCMPEKK